MMKLHLPTIIRNAANKTVLWETPNIKKAFIVENNKGETILKTDGLNIIVSDYNYFNCEQTVSSLSKE